MLHIISGLRRISNFIKFFLHEVKVYFIESNAVRAYGFVLKDWSKSKKFLDTIVNVAIFNNFFLIHLKISLSN